MWNTFLINFDCTVSSLIQYGEYFAKLIQSHIPNLISITHTIYYKYYTVYTEKFYPFT